LLAMFLQEWALQRGDAALHTVAIIDDTPAEQYLYPEFRLAARMFRRHGINALILDPAALTFVDGALWHDGSIYTASPPNIWKLTDTDGDGVMDLHDNCDLTVNPSQLDTNADGIGDACS